MEFSDTQVRGADLSVSLSNIIGLDDVVLSVEGSVLNRFSKISIDAEEAGGKPNTLGWSGRLNFDYDGFFVKGEYVDLGKKLVAYTPKRGNAQLVEMGSKNTGESTGKRVSHVPWNFRSTWLTVYHRPSIVFPVFIAKQASRLCYTNKQER